jgi:glutaredoxin-like protein NrdH
MTVTVYTKNNCQPCRATKRVLDRSGISYTSINVDEEAAVREWLIERGHTSSPIVIVGDSAAPVDEWAGFRPDKLETLPAVLAGS